MNRKPLPTIIQGGMGAGVSSWSLARAVSKAGQLGVVSGTALTVATNDFLARGGDQYPYRGAPFTNLGVTYQQALVDYIQDHAGLNGMVTAGDYPTGGEGRIKRLP